MSVEKVIEEILKAYGYQVEKIPTSEVKTPDFLVFDSTSAYLLEVKTKLPSREQIRERKEILHAGEFYQLNEPIIPNKRLTEIIKKAERQLREYKSQTEVLRLVWLAATDYLEEARMDQFEATLYGSTCVVDWSTRGRAGTCYFFYNSDFFRFRDVLDAAIVSAGSKYRLLLNPLSKSYERMKNSSLACHLHDGVVDPIAIEAQGKAFIVDGDVDRNNEAEVLAFLQTKYESAGIRKITMNLLSGTLAIRKETDET